MWPNKSLQALTWRGEVCSASGSCGAASGIPNQVLLPISLATNGFTYESADSSSHTLAYAAGDLGYAVRKTEDSLLDEACSSLMTYDV